jgi:hypothetical protein
MTEQGEQLLDFNETRAETLRDPPPQKRGGGVAH